MGFCAQADLKAYQHRGSSTGYMGCTKKGTVAEQEHGQFQQLHVLFSWLFVTLMFLSQAQHPS